MYTKSTFRQRCQNELNMQKGDNMSLEQAIDQQLCRLCLSPLVSCTNKCSASYYSTKQLSSPMRVSLNFTMCGLMYAYPLLILFSFFAAHQMMDLLGHITSPRGTLLGCCLSQKSHPVYYLPSRSISALTTCPDLQTKKLVFKNITLTVFKADIKGRKKSLNILSTSEN